MPIPALRRRAALVAGFAALLPPGRDADATTPGARPGDLLRAVDGRPDAVLRLPDLVPDARPVLAWPVDPDTLRARSERRFNQVLVVRASPTAASAFTAVCTHAGCIVADWQAAGRLALCPCHGSEYDLGRDGVVARGPAPLPLPRLPLRLAGETLVVAGPFDAPVGGHTGRTD